MSPALAAINSGLRIEELFPNKAIGGRAICHVVTNQFEDAILPMTDQSIKGEGGEREGTQRDTLLRQKARQ